MQFPVAQDLEGSDDEGGIDGVGADMQGFVGEVDEGEGAGVFDGVVGGAARVADGVRVDAGAAAPAQAL